MRPESAEQIVEQFEGGQLSRRQLVTRLMGLGAAMAVIPDAARASQDGEKTFQATGLNHIALNVRDLKRSAEFYQTHLGLKVIRKQGDKIWFLGRGDGIFLALFRNDNPGLSHYCYTLENYDPDEAVRKLNAAGIKHRRERHGVYIAARYGVAVQRVGPEFHFQVSHGAEFVPRVVVDFRGRIRSIQVKQPSLDDVFLKLTGRIIREEEGTALDRMRQIRKMWTGRR